MHYLLKLFITLLTLFHFAYAEGDSTDSDNDGLSDIQEINMGLNPNSPYGYIAKGIQGIGHQRTQHTKMMFDLRRLTFGPTDTSVAAYQRLGRTAWLEQQLTPVTDVAEDIAQPMRESMLIPRTRLPDRNAVVRYMHSNKQIQAKVAWFWNDHFNTDIRKTRRGIEELEEQDLFFENALGNFRTLLGLSAKGYPMLQYLDLRSSKKQNPNENYARELLELHTLGEGRYTAKDIAEVARAFTGWGLERDTTIVHRYSYEREEDNEKFNHQKGVKFIFRPNRHDVGEDKTFLGHIIETREGADGIQEGEEILDIVAYHRVTAHRICNKLVDYFVSEGGNFDLRNACAATFHKYREANNQIALVLKTIFTHREYKPYQSKIKDNLEAIMAIARFNNLDANISRSKSRYIGDTVRSARQGIFRKAEPTGYGELGKTIVNDMNMMYYRRASVRDLVLNKKWRYRGESYITQMQNLGFSTSGEIIQYLLERLYGNIFNKSIVLDAYSIMHPDDTPFNLNRKREAERRLKHLVLFLALHPSGQRH